jgi:carbon storage regulator
MLVLGRREEERILIGDSIEVIVCKIRDSRCEIGIKAPEGVQILRAELKEEEKSNEDLHNTI